MIAARCNRCGNIGCSGNTIFCMQNNININPYSIEQQVKEQLEYFKRGLLRLEKYEYEYVKIEDVLALFSAKKE